jgi:hypothetical protein
MSLRSTPGPGGFGPSPAFGHARPGITPRPLRTSPHPGVYSGPAVHTGNHLWWWAVLVIVIGVAVTVAIAIRRRRAA